MSSSEKSSVNCYSLEAAESVFKSAVIDLESAHVAMEAAHVAMETAFNKSRAARFIQRHYDCLTVFYNSSEKTRKRGDNVSWECYDHDEVFEESLEIDAALIHDKTWSLINGWLNDDKETWIKVPDGYEDPDDYDAYQDFETVLWPVGNMCKHANDYSEEFIKSAVMRITTVMI